jgi:hypothetical protein
MPRSARRLWYADGSVHKVRDRPAEPLTHHRAPLASRLPGPAGPRITSFNDPGRIPGTLVPPQTRFRACCLLPRWVTLGGQEGR